jgi:hypothetical protein
MELMFIPPKMPPPPVPYGQKTAEYEAEYRAQKLKYEADVRDNSYGALVLGGIAGAAFTCAVIIAAYAIYTTVY